MGLFFIGTKGSCDRVQSLVQCFTCFASEVVNSWKIIYLCFDLVCLAKDTILCMYIYIYI